MKGGMRTAVATLVALLYVCALSERWLEGQAQGNARGTTQSQTPTAAKSPQRALVDQYCVACHNEKLKSGGLTLSALNLDAPDQSAEVAAVSYTHLTLPTSDLV